MNIKDFQKGQTVYILDMHKGRNTEPTIYKAVVDSVGRKYVTTGRGGKYEASNDEYSLTEHTGCGSRTYLCPSMEYAQLYIEREELKMWLYNMPHLNRKYTLDQLRKVKEILDGEINKGADG